MTPTQKYLLNLLMEIDLICKKNDIQYFIEYGTTLGAIRHEGFIPWDNDVDVLMTEDNYYKWIKACQKDLDPEKRVYCDVRIDREYPMVFGRYFDIETARITPKFQFWNKNCGQCIDVFYMIELPGNIEKRQEIVDLYYAYDEYANSSFRHIRYRSEKGMQLYRQFCLKEKQIGKDAVLKEIEEQIFNKHYDDCEYYLVCSARMDGTTVVPKAHFDTVDYVDFEGYSFPVAGGYVELMTQYYGDTFYLYPKDKDSHQEMSHAGIPSKVYVEDYMPLFDKNNLLEERQQLKHLEVKEGYYMTRLHKAYYDKMGACEVLKIKRKIQKEDINLKNYLSTTNLSLLVKIDQLFTDYYNKQLSQGVRYWRVYFRLEDDLFYVAIFNLFYGRNDYNSISKLIQLRIDNNIPMTNEIEEIWNLVLLIRKIRANIIYKNYNDAEKNVKTALKLAPDCREFQVQETVLKCAQAKTESELLACEELAKKILVKYPKEDRCIKVLGDVAFRNNNIEKAKKYYRWVMQNSQNGFLHLDIKKKIGEGL